MSGFDSPAECFGDLSRHVFAVETGLSSDPPMNWRVRSLDGLALVSNSDLHSPAKLGRNANVFFGAPDYFVMLDGLRRRDPAVCGGTVDLFPEEGKYHLDGHRVCGFGCEPEETRRLGGICPRCGKPLTVGVLHRVAALANRPAGCRRPAGALPHRYIVPLDELLGELLDVGPASKRVRAAYDRLLAACGPELAVLLTVPPKELEAHGPPRLGEAMQRLRAGQVTRRGGFDGQFGFVRTLT
jgi:DNA helicase II / ATP-dependent DNA helicase PcrA